jgi:membrane protein YqaA with SNARE-associated domain
LLLVSYIGGTLLPFSPSAALAAGLLAGIPPFHAFAAASAGTVAALTTNFCIGYSVGLPIQRKLATTGRGSLALSWLTRYGYWALLASPLPILGDPITMLAGVLRLHFSRFALVVFPLRLAGFALILHLLAT